MHNSWDSVLELSARSDVVLTADEVATWPPGMLDALVQIGVLRETVSAGHIVCGECSEKHVERVHEIRMGDDSTLHHIFCPDAGKVPVAPDQLRQWTIDCDGLARAAANALSAAGDVETLVADCLWRLGTISADDRSFSAVLARLDLVSDRQRPLAAVSSVANDKTILFTVGALNETAVTDAGVAVVLPLSAVIRWRNGGLHADRGRLETSIPTIASGADKPLVDEATRTLTYREKICGFSSRAKDQFALFMRINRNPGRYVNFDTLRQPGDVFGEYGSGDDSIRSAVRRLRDSLKKAGMARRLHTDGHDSRQFARRSRPLGI